MAKVLLFHCKDETGIRQILTPMKIKAISVPDDKFHLTIGEMEKEKWGTETFQGIGPKESALIMCDFTKKQMDTFLLELRKKGVMVDYKAVLTPTNRNWDINHFYFEMAKEKSMYMRMMAKKNNKIQ